ncbi:hypothetical protein FKW77_008587 [Venturia effusa]|uniref:Uncharacterized protein n=1 Tax=Venturia effusa TaxID=50376 RepID=A0A517L3V7_9PEZI|nr:hypothetical protein FKW77_008587 [Venturia effusa]
MPSRDPYTCCVCKKVHKGIHCWSDDSDEDIDSGLLKAMATLVPKKGPGIVDKQEVPHRVSRAQSILSMESWERGDSSSLLHVGVPTPSVHQTATAPLSNTRQENESTLINNSVPDANTHIQQTPKANRGSSHHRIDSGTQVWRRSEEYLVSPKPDYAFSQISMVPQPLRIPNRQAQQQAEHHVTGNERDPRLQPGSQYRASNEHKRVLHDVKQNSSTPVSGQREQERQQSPTNQGYADRTHDQWQSQKGRVSPPPGRTSQTNHERSNPAQAFRTSQETIDNRVARGQRGHVQQNHGRNEQATPPSTKPRSPGSAAERVQIPRQKSGETTFTHFMKAGRPPHQSRQQGQSTGQQTHRTSGQDRRRSDQRGREDDLSGPGEVVRGHARIRPKRPSQETDRSVTGNGESRDADKMPTRERELRDTQRQLQRQNEEAGRPGAAPPLQRHTQEIQQPIGNLQKQFQRGIEEQIAALHVTHRLRDDKRQHRSISRRREEHIPQRQYQPSRLTREDSGTQNRHEDPTVEKVIYTTYQLDNTQRQHPNHNQRSENSTRQQTIRQTHPSPTRHAHKKSSGTTRHNQANPHDYHPTTPGTTHAPADQKKYYHHDRQIALSPPASPTNPYPNHIPAQLRLSQTHFFTDAAIVGRAEEGRQRHWEYALERLEGRIGDGDGDVEGGMKRVFK